MTFLKNGNTYLSKLTSHEINNLLWEVSNFYIPARSTLDLEKNIFFGTELEYGNANQQLVTKKVNELIKQGIINKNWESKNDTSVRTIINNITYGGEVTSPKSNDSQKIWQEMSLICNELKKLKAIINEKTSLHVHFDQSILGPNPKIWLNFIKLWIIYEEIIYRFCFGEYATSRDNMEKHFNPVREKYLKQFKLYDLNGCTNLDTLLSRIKLTKYFALNFMNTNYTYTEELSLIPKKNTIELRASNGTLDPVIIQNIVYFYSRLLLASYKVNEKFIDEKLSLLTYKKEDFDNIYIYESLELADIIFTNNFDKFCFLRQYIKSYEVSKDFTRVRRFTA